jgi:hypothetical protein
MLLGVEAVEDPRVMNFLCFNSTSGMGSHRPPLQPEFKPVHAATIN